MSKKAEERALECYPIYEFSSNGKDINRRDRNIYIQGYEQAEKDLALTWEDMWHIFHIMMRICETDEYASPHNSIEFHEEVLRRFNDDRK